jgi:hypothetical protein
MLAVNGHPNDYCRYVVYDETKTIDEPMWMRKVICESFRHPKLAYFTVFRNGETQLEFTNKTYTIEQMSFILDAVKNEKFQEPFSGGLSSPA